MKRVRFKSNLLNIVTTTAVLLSLLTISIIQYRWLISSVERDIIELYRRLNLTIFKSISYELNNTFFPKDKLLTLTHFNDEDYKNKLEQFVNESNNKYGDYINSIGFLSKSYKLFSYDNISWEEKGNLTLDGEEFGKFMPDKYNPGMVKFLFFSNGENNIMTFIYFDLYNLYNNKIKDTLEPYLENYELEWHFILPEKGKVVDERNYKYSPIKSIKNILLKETSDWYIGLDIFMEMESLQKDANKRFIFRPIRPDSKLTKEHDYPIYINILVDGKPLLQSKENYLTVQWLLNILLLLGIATAYIFILNQIRKLKNIRVREKEFVASVTHELRTPLAVIHSAADNIKSGIISPDRIIQYGQLITDHSKRLSKMIEGILLFSRFEGKAELPPVLEVIDVSFFNDIFNGLAEIIKKEYNITLNIELSLPKTLSTNKDSIELILTNLIMNSAKHAYGHNNIDSFIRIKAHLQLPNIIIFIVEDDGVGIEKKEMKYIFEPFFRGTLSYRKQINGSGLGLFLTYKTVKLLGGTIKAISPYERVDGKLRTGTKFIVSIPYINEEK